MRFYQEPGKRPLVLLQHFMCNDRHNANKTALRPPAPTMSNEKKYDIAVTSAPEFIA
ncbi:MAG: hypothetical protein QG619_865, partial [Pseudomonadota bacterium]|nr:hypothetical protein [Pseudomonadota bacterium]